MPGRMSKSFSSHVTKDWLILSQRQRQQMRQLMSTLSQGRCFLNEKDWAPHLKGLLPIMNRAQFKSRRVLAVQQGVLHAFASSPKPGAEVPWSC